MTYRVGQQVWLKAVPEEGWPRERGVLVTKEDERFYEGMWVVRVEPEDENDDGIREIHEEQIEGAADDV